jgi:hypothetical protein
MRLRVGAAAIATNQQTGQRCLVADAKATELPRDSGTLEFPPTPYRLWPVDPCRELVGVPIRLQLDVTPTGVIQAASAETRNFSVDEVPVPAG